jgi:hypothetical protein
LKVFMYIITGIILALLAVYYGSYYIMPSVTVINKSGVDIKSTIINLPNSNLDFGAFSQGQQNTIHYALAQSDGVYKYQFDFEDKPSIIGECGYVTQNQINKRVVITLTSKEVVCELR